MMAANDGSYGYEMEIIVPADSAIQSPADIEGKALAFTAPTPNSGFKAPSALLLSEFGLEADKDYKTAFSCQHDHSVLGVSNKAYAEARKGVVQGKSLSVRVDSGGRRTI